MSVILYCLKNFFFAKLEQGGKVDDQNNPKNCIATEKVQTNKQMHLQIKCDIKTFPIPPMKEHSGG